MGEGEGHAISNTHDEKTPIGVTGEFIESGKGVEPSFRHLGDKAEWVLFPELLPKFAGPRDPESFKHFHTKGQEDAFWYVDGPLGIGEEKDPFRIRTIPARLMFRTMENRLERKGLLLWIELLSMGLGLGVIVLGILGIIGELLTSSNFGDAAFLITIAVIGCSSGIVGRGIGGQAKEATMAWESDKKGGRSMLRSSHEFWNREIFKLWKTKLPERLDDLCEKQEIRCTESEKSEVMSLFENVVAYCNTGGNDLPTRDVSKPNPNAIHRMRLIFVWPSEELTGKYQQYLESERCSCSRDFLDLKKEDLEKLTHPISEFSRVQALSDIKRGLRRLPIDVDADKLLEKADFWLDRKITSLDRTQRVGFKAQVLDFTEDWKAKKTPTKPMLLVSRAASGKSTTLNLLCIQSTSSDSPLLPLRIKLKQQSNSEYPSEGTLLSFVREMKKREVPDGIGEEEWGESLAYFFRGGSEGLSHLPSPVLILDGLDEMDSNRKHWKDAIMSMHEILVIVSSRPEIGLDGERHFDFDEVTVPQRKTLLEISGLSKLNLNVELEEAMSKLSDDIFNNSPFVVFLVLNLLRNIDESGNSDSLDLSIDALSRSFIDQLIRREWEKKGQKNIALSDFIDQAPVEIGNKIRDKTCDEEIINFSVNLRLLGPDQEPLDSWLEGHYLARSISSDEDEEIFDLNDLLKPYDGEPEKRDLVLRHLISTSGNRMPKWSDFGIIAPLVFKIIAEEWSLKAKKDQSQLLHDFGINWSIGEPIPIASETLSMASEKGLETISGLLHLHCWIVGSTNEGLRNWRSYESDSAWEELVVIALEEIEALRISNLEEEKEIYAFFLEKARRRYKIKFGGLHNRQHASPLLMPVTKELAIFVKEYLEPYNKVELREVSGTEEFRIRNLWLRKVLRDIEFFQGESNEGPPSGLNFLAWLLLSRQGKGESLISSRREIEMLQNSSAWIPFDQYATRTKRVNSLGSVELSLRPLTSLISTISKSGYSVESLVFLLSFIESISAEPRLKINIKEAKLIQKILPQDGSDGEKSRLIISRLLGLRNEENSKIFVESADILDRLSNELVQTGAVLVKVTKDDEAVRVFSLSGNEMTEGLHSDYQRSFLRYFDAELQEKKLSRLLNLSGYARIIADGTEHRRMSPVLICDGGPPPEIEDKVRDILLSDLDQNGFTTIIETNWRSDGEVFEGRSLLNHPNFGGLVAKLKIEERSLILSPRTSRDGSTCRFGCNRKNCRCADKVSLYIINANRSLKAGADDEAVEAMGSYESSIAVRLTNPAKRIILEPPSQNVEFSRIATSFNSNHTYENHRDVGIQLDEISENEISEKCYVYLRNDGVGDNDGTASGTKFPSTWWQEHHSLAIPGLRTSDVVFSNSPDDPDASLVKEGFCEFFPKKEFKEAVGRWYLCYFEIKPSLLGYELILPIPESIELLCQQCLRLSISKPIVTEDNEFYVCHDCYKDLGK